MAKFSRVTMQTAKSKEQLGQYAIWQLEKDIAYQAMVLKSMQEQGIAAQYCSKQEKAIVRLVKKLNDATEGA